MIRILIPPPSSFRKTMLCLLQRNFSGWSDPPFRKFIVFPPQNHRKKEWDWMTIIWTNSSNESFHSLRPTGTGQEGEQSIEAFISFEEKWVKRIHTNQNQIIVQIIQIKLQKHLWRFHRFSSQILQNDVKLCRHQKCCFEAVESTGSQGSLWAPNFKIRSDFLKTSPVSTWCIWWYIHHILRGKCQMSNLPRQWCSGCTKGGDGVHFVQSTSHFGSSCHEKQLLWEAASSIPETWRLWSNS